MIMGCVSSTPDINNTHPNIFHVINVNDMGRPVSRGKLEVAENELILHQKGKYPIKWPLVSLRKYGCDELTNTFSIECGRRSPTGPGYYAFKCAKAKELFNMVQFHILGGAQQNSQLNNSNHLVHPNHIDPSVRLSISGSAGPLHRHVVPPGVSNGVQPLMRPHNTGLSRPSSITSDGGQVNPIAVLPLEHNNNKQPVPGMENGVGGPNYVNVNVGDSESTGHVYMNVDTKEVVNSPSPNSSLENKENKRELNEEIHCYANIGTKEVESLQLMQQQACYPNNGPGNGEIVETGNSAPCSPTDYVTVREVNYAELDLEAVKNESGKYLNGHADETVTVANNVTAVPLQDSPTLPRKSYATIDFPKTIALSQSINPKADLEEGSRKTRHNSTINSFSD